MLNGSWLLRISPTGKGNEDIRGPMRIEVDNGHIRVSGDIYVKSRLATQSMEELIPSSAVKIETNWYPSFPQSQYRWYFRSSSAEMKRNDLFVRFERHIWNAKQQQYGLKDNGTLVLTCGIALSTPPGAPKPTLVWQGRINFDNFWYDVTAIKTSPYFRGCFVEVDVMVNRQWPDVASSCDGLKQFTFTESYRESGMDFLATVDQTNIPEKASLSVPDLHTMMATYQAPPTAQDQWRLWLLVGSSSDGGGLGLMFDTGRPPHRQGAAGFSDAMMANITRIHPSCRGKKLGMSKHSFLRTMIHEAGHAFNLYHPKHDVHGVPVGTTIMNQTQDVLGFATVVNPYPCNATMGFDRHNLASLIHSPDPQVKPGWKEFGWGHGVAHPGIAEPADVAGISSGDLSTDLELRLEGIPKQLVRGEMVMVTVTLKNISNQPQEVPPSLNLAEGDLKLHVTTPSQQDIQVRDVTVICADRRFVTLQPGAEIKGQIQLHYGPHGLTFNTVGHHTIRAEMDLGNGLMVHSAPIDLTIKPAVTEGQQQLEKYTMNHDVGLAFSLGDTGLSQSTFDQLKQIATEFPRSYTGIASGLILANTLLRDLVNVRNGEILRASQPERGTEILNGITYLLGSLETLARLATVVVSPRDLVAPVLQEVRKHIQKAVGLDASSADKDGGGSEDDMGMSNVLKILDDHLS
ncbi:hypothetical protein [Candidatus Magnetaquiglobus chichijimensis]|uniref:hypothetical protein n=1 Tax=Candidatus Magnetaquiglobus chichijimensis TaxID=3141448 RepID=UPI003B96F5E0